MLNVQDLSCGYGGAPVLRELSFKAAVGSVLCIMGPNGCGKTTLLRAVAGMLPYSGSIAAAGLEVGQVRRAQLAKRVALMSQISEVYFSYTVYETVMMGRYAHQKHSLLEQTTAADHQLVRDCLARTGTLELCDRYITQLSGGQLQRVLLARTFAQTPQLILLDEPTNHLDLKYQLELTGYLREWVQQGQRCVVGVLHDINLALSFADDLLLLREGRVAGQGTAANFPLAQIGEVYEVDVCAYMQQNLKRWE